MAHDHHVRTGLLSTLVSGAKDIPRTRHGWPARPCPTRARRTGRPTRRPTTAVRADWSSAPRDAVRDAMPGQDSVEDRLARARDGAERAQEAEEQAVQRRRAGT